ncbi:MAG: acetyltransferase [Rhodothermales bacterium]|nr:acetyltransferase [Rhodothermales bacterium]
MSDLVIVGAGGFGAETAALVEDINDTASRWSLVGFLDDDPELHGTSVIDYPVLGEVDWLSKHRARYVAAVGRSRVREELTRRLSNIGATPATLLHPTVSIHASSSVGQGSILCRATTVTVRTMIGAHCIVNLHCTIGHDCSLGDCSTLHPGVHVSGDSRIGAGVEIGTGAVILPGVQIGAGSIVGAGAVVTRDLPAGVVAAGVPARVTRELDD